MEEKNTGKLKTTSLGQSLTSVRLLAAIFVISSFALQFIYTTYLPNFIDPVWARLAINISVTLFFISTFVRSYSTRALDRIVLFLYTVIICYTLFLTSINQFHSSAVTLVIFVMAGGTIILTSTYLFSLQSVLVILFSIIQIAYSGFNETSLIGVFNIFVAIAVSGMLLFVRLRMIDEVRFSNSLLEKNHLFSIIANTAGEIIFISPSVTATLGYSRRELLHEGWWKNEKLAHAWIEKEYILNYPGAVPPEIKSIENTVVSKDGNVIWLSWTTSLLPGGNYMGVAIDITRYKVNTDEVIQSLVLTLS